MVHAQQGERMRRIGILLPHPEGDAEGQTFVAVFQQRLQELGWMEGSNISDLITRWGRRRSGQGTDFR